MGKKKIRKHQKEPNESSHSSEEEKNDHAGKSCPHIVKSVSINGIKKILKSGVNIGTCQTCTKQVTSSPEERNGVEDDAEQHDSEPEPDTWLCLQCGNQGCDCHSKHKHALVHFNTPRSDKHALVISVSTWKVWCYECDDEIAAYSNKKLFECVTFLQKLQVGTSVEQEKPNSGKAPIANVKEVELNGADVSSDENPNKKSTKCNSAGSKVVGKPKVDAKVNNTPKVKGLSNLGNTCFFNAIMQNLAQTHLLIRLVEERSPKGTLICLPGIRHDANADSQTCDSKEWQLEPKTLKLSECGGLTQALANFFRDMVSASKAYVVNPSQVFGQICRKSPQFRGSKQQDSHELLRHLLDGVRTEETKRQRLGILHAFNLPSKVDPETVDEQTKRRVKAYGRQASHTLIDHVFSGQLISTVLCKECQVSSQVFEPFLDLSLPIAEEKPLRPGMQKKASVEDSLCVEDDLYKATSKSSKQRHIERNARRRAAKEAQRNKYRRSKSSNEIGTILAEDHESSRSPLSDDAKKPSGMCEEETSEPSDADVEDNAESESTQVAGRRCHMTMDDLASRIVSEEIAQTPLQDLSSQTSDLASPSNLLDDLCSQMSDAALTETGNGHDNILESVAGDSGAKTASEAELTSGYANSVSTPLSERDCGEKVERGRERKWKFKQDWIAKSLTTLASRYQSESHECSVLSCLHQFTAPELLTGNNKFGCENCTKVKAEKMGSKPEGKKSELVYSNASKQLLIFSPPAVLTLHLKRFHQVGYSLRKVNRHVDFPLILDLAPFCSSICLGLPNMKKGQTKVLYSLYGVTQHSGRLVSGHYTAYVKVRSQGAEPNRQFLNLKPAGQYEIDRLVAEMARNASSVEEFHQGDVDNAGESDDEVPIEPPPGKWFHISDGHVMEVLEKNVLQSQAYILFYERIL